MQIDTEIAEMNIVDEEEQILEKIAGLRERLGDKVYILGHHYQRDNILKFTDRTGDSFGLSKYVAEHVKSPYIIFCGVHFMAETADILSADDKKVILPDLTAGCSMADMADIDQVEECWDVLTEATDAKIVPVTYVNSTAAIKAFVGKHGGTVCTSSNADKIVKWALEQGDKVLFLPDQHLGRNTAYKMGIPLEEMALYDPLKPDGGEPIESYAASKVILWQGYCSVHMNFKSQYIDLYRKEHPDINILVHPECEFETVQKADFAGSTSYIIKTVNEAEIGSKWAIGTENHLVDRLKHDHPDKLIIPLSAYACQCSTMYRIDPEHLLNVLVAISDGEVVNQISVPKEIAVNAKKALDKMLEIS